MENYNSNLSGEQIEELLSPATATKRGTIKGSDSVTIDADGTARVNKTKQVHYLTLADKDWAFKVDFYMFNDTECSPTLEEIKAYLSKINYVSCTGEKDYGRGIIYVIRKESNDLVYGYFDGSAKVSERISFNDLIIKQHYNIDF